MKVRITGNVASIISEIPAKKLNKLFDKLEVKDKDGNTEYAAQMAAKDKAGSLSQYGIVFNATNKEGQAMVQLDVAEDTSDECFAASKADALIALQKYEATLVKLITTRENDLEDVAKIIERD